MVVCIAVSNVGAHLWAQCPGLKRMIMAEAYLAGQQMTKMAIEILDDILPTGNSSITLPVPARAVLIAKIETGGYPVYGKWDEGYLVLRGKRSPYQSLSSDGLTLTNSDNTRSYYVIIIA
jgi:hypothetical protein